MFGQRFGTLFSLSVALSAASLLQNYFSFLHISDLSEWIFRCECLNGKWTIERNEYLFQPLSHYINGPFQRLCLKLCHVYYSGMDCTVKCFFPKKINYAIMFQYSPFQNNKHDIVQDKAGGMAHLCCVLQAALYKTFSSDSSHSHRD